MDRKKSSSEIKDIFKTRLKATRTAKKLNQPQLAKIINSTDRNVSNYETGYSLPSIKVLYDISVGLSTSADYLLGLTDNPTVSNNEKQLTEDDFRLLNKLKSDEEIYTYLTKNSEEGVHYIYKIWKLMDEWKKN